MSHFEIVIFPEGGIPVAGARLPFKAGAFELAIRTAAPILPVAIHGSANVLPPKGRLGVRPGTVCIQALDPISTEGLTLEDLSGVHGEAERAILAALDAAQPTSSPIQRCSEPEPPVDSIPGALRRGTPPVLGIRSQPWSKAVAISTLGGMDAAELWVESYQGEVLGEALFGAMAEREEEPERRHQLEILTLLEHATKELADPVFERRGVGRGDTEKTLADARELADAVAHMTWIEFIASIPPVTVNFLAKYRQLVDLATDGQEREIAQAYVAHEEALASFAHRCLGEEAGDPLERILALPHVAAAAAA